MPPSTQPAATEQFSRQGFLLQSGVLTEGELEDLRAEMARLAADGACQRHLLRRSPLVRELAVDPRLTDMVWELLGMPGRAVRAILFDKTSEQNWAVPWHQDMSIAVAERHPMLGYGPWTVKDGVAHVVPPEELLRRMVTVRLAIDADGERNGPLLVLPGSHQRGKLREEEVRALATEIAPVQCLMPAGGALFLSPLLVHSSKRADKPSTRRVLHLEFAAGGLPAPLQWEVDAR